MHKAQNQRGIRQVHPSTKVQIGKREAEHGMAAMVHYAINMVNGYFYLEKNLF